MDRPQMIARLRQLEHAAHDAAARVDGSEALAAAYRSLRDEAAAMNAVMGWASAEGFSTTLPSLEAIAEIESLDANFGQTRQPGLPLDRGSDARLCEALDQLGAWAGGLRLAYETLDQADPR